MSGFNGTIFAYGITGSGKTYTMLGTPKSPGVMPLALRDVFTYIEEVPEREFLLRVSYMEIYNEKIRDLLSKESKTIEVRENEEQDIVINNLTEEIIHSGEGINKILSMIARGEARRAYGATNLNERSSRSHTIFRVIIESTERYPTAAASEASVTDTDDEESEEMIAVRVSTLNLVDLSGSERVSLSGADGSAFTEACYINKSLLSLGNVVEKLANEKHPVPHHHIPYRDSKLTRILQCSLGGNSKTAVICTTTLAAQHYTETANSLIFAARASNVQNLVTINEVHDDSALIQKFRKEMSSLRTRLHEVSPGFLSRYNRLERAKQDAQTEKERMEAELHKQERIRLSLEKKVANISNMLLKSSAMPPPSPISKEAHCHRRRAFSLDDLDRVRVMRKAGGLSDEELQKDFLLSVETARVSREQQQKTREEMEFVTQTSVKAKEEQQKALAHMEQMRIQHTLCEEEVASMKVSVQDFEKILTQKAEEYDVLMSQLTATREDLDQMTVSYQSEKESRENLAEKLASARAQSDEVSAQMSEKSQLAMEQKTELESLHRKSNEQKAELESLHRKSAMLEKQVKHHEGQAKDMGSERDDLSTKLSMLREENVSLLNELKESYAAKIAARAEIESTNEALLAAETTKRNLMARLEEAEDQRSRAVKRADSAEEQFHEARSSLEERILQWKMELERRTALEAELVSLKDAGESSEQSLQTEISAVLSKKAALEAELVSLNDAKESSEQQLRAEISTALSQNEDLQAELVSLNDAKEGLEQSLRAEISTLLSKKEELETELTAMRQEFSETVENHKQSYHQVLGDTDARVSDVETRLRDTEARLQEEIDSLSASLKTANTDLEFSINHRAVIEKNLNEDIAALTAKLAEAEEALQASEEKAETCAAQCEELKSSITAVTTERQEVSTVLQEKETQLKQLTEEIKTLEQQSSGSLQDLREKLQQSATEGSTLQERNRMISEELTHATAELEKTRNLHLTVSGEREQLSAKLQELSEQLSLSKDSALNSEEKLRSRDFQLQGIQKDLETLQAAHEKLQTRHKGDKEAAIKWNEERSLITKQSDKLLLELEKSQFEKTSVDKENAKLVEEVQKLSAALERCSEKLREAENSNERLSLQHDMLKEDAKREKSEIGELKEDKLRQLKELDMVRAQCTEAEAELRVNRQKLESLNQQWQRNSEELAFVRSENSELKYEYKGAKEKVETMQSENHVLHERLSVLEEQHQQAQASAALLLNEKEKLELELVTQKNSLEQKLQIAENERKDTASKAEILQAKVESVSEELRVANSSYKDVGSHVQQLESKLATILSEKEKSLMQLEMAKESCEHLSEERNKLKDAVQNLQSDLQKATTGAAAEAKASHDVLEERNKIIEELQRNIGDLREETHAFHNLEITMKEQIDALHTALLQASQDATFWQQKADVSVRERDQFQGKSEAAEEKIDALKSDLSDAQKDRETLRSQHSELERQIHDVKVALQASEENHHSREEALISINQKALKQDEHIVTLETQLKELKHVQDELAGARQQIMSLSGDVALLSSLLKAEEESKLELESKYQEQVDNVEALKTIMLQLEKDLHRERESRERERGSMSSTGKQITELMEVRNQLTTLLRMEELARERAQKDMQVRENELREADARRKQLLEKLRESEDSRSAMFDKLKSAEEELKVLRAKQVSMDAEGTRRDAVLQEVTRKYEVLVSTLRSGEKENGSSQKNKGASAHASDYDRTRLLSSFLSAIDKVEREVGQIQKVAKEGSRPFH
jgi:centromeric protein E